MWFRLAKRFPTFESLSARNFLPTKLGEFSVLESEKITFWGFILTRQINFTAGSKHPRQCYFHSQLDFPEFVPQPKHGDSTKATFKGPPQKLQRENKCNTAEICDRQYNPLEKFHNPAILLVFKTFIAL